MRNVKSLQISELLETKVKPAHKKCVGFSRSIAFCYFFKYNFNKMNGERTVNTIEETGVETDFDHGTSVTDRVCE